MKIDAATPVILAIVDFGGQDDFASLLTQYYRGEVSALAKRVDLVEPSGLTGGVALNEALRCYLSKQLGADLWVPEERCINFKSYCS